MIKVKCLETGFEHIVKPTIFPDGTSQVWKLPKELFQGNKSIRWYFENEVEFIYLKQLTDLLYNSNYVTMLYIPYLPYARQDKYVSNETTFAKQSFLDILNTLKVTDISSLDIHSFKNTKIFNVEVSSFHRYVIDKVKPTHIVFPDEGAANRYPYLKEFNHVIFEKNRCPETGQILCHVPMKPIEMKSGDNFLLIDDICDGGATFISISNLLHEVKENIGVSLCVTHGLFSKGTEILHNSGINSIFTTNSLLRNHGQENVFEV